MLREEIKQFLSVPKRHPWAFTAAYIPVVAGVIVSSVIDKFTFAYCLPMLWCFFASLFLIQGVEEGQLTDNNGTVIRRQNPVRFWAKFSIWSAFYVFAIVWCIGFALQERGKLTAEPDGAANGSQPVR